MKVTDDQIRSIVDRVVEQLAVDSHEPSNPTQALPRTSVPVLAPSPPARPTFVPGPRAWGSGVGELGCFPDLDTAVEAAQKAFEEFRSISIEQRKRIVAAVREICMEHLEDLARMAVEETGLGRYEDKLVKNRLAILKTPGVEDIEANSFVGDDGLTLEERCPFGVLGSITPTTNPSETIINNGIGMLAGGNSVVFHPHPSSRKVSLFTINIMNKAVISEGGPPNLFTTLRSPTIQSAQRLMKHRGIRLLVVTGGPVVVRAAMQSGKRVIAAGPGNPPVVVDETADLEQAARDIVTSASTDNNIICVVEKEIIATRKALAPLKKYMLKHGAVELSPFQTRRLKNLILDDHGHVEKRFVGKDVQVILREIGMEVDASKRLAITQTDADHPFAVQELMLPVVPLIQARDIDEAIDIAYTLEQGCFHTACIHSKNIDNMHKMAIKMNTSLFVKNGGSLAGLGLGGEGPTSFTIASPTGEGMTTARTFTRIRRCTLKGYFGVL